MSVSLPNGSTVSIAATYAAVKAVTGISNASPAIATAVAHGFLAGDIVEIASGWSDLAGRAARVKAPIAADTFALDGFDTTSQQRYPTGGGVGSARKVLTWQPITQVLDAAMTGGEQQFYTYSFLEDVGDERQLPTNRSARTLTLTIADDPTLPQYQVLKAANDARTPVIVRFALANGSAIYFSAYVSFSEMPTLTKNEAMAQVVTLSLAGAPTRYTGA